MDKLFLVNPTYPLLRATFTRRSETKERGARQTEKKKKKEKSLNEFLSSNVPPAGTYSAYSINHTRASI